MFSFLESVSDKASSKNVDDALLHKCASDMFSDSALIWYRSGVERDVFSSWSGFSTQEIIPTPGLDRYPDG